MYLYARHGKPFQWGLGWGLDGQLRFQAAFCCAAYVLVCGAALFVVLLMKITAQPPWDTQNILALNRMEVFLSSTPQTP